MIDLAPIKLRDVIEPGFIPLSSINAASTAAGCFGARKAAGLIN